MNIKHVIIYFKILECVTSVLYFFFVSEIDLLPLCTTFLLSLVLGVEYGTIIGIGVDLMLLLYPIAKPGYQVGNTHLSYLQPSSTLPQIRPTQSTPPVYHPSLIRSCTHSSTNPGYKHRTKMLFLSLVLGVMVLS